MSKTNVLLISKTTEQALEIRKSLSQIPGYKLEFQETAEGAMSLITKGIMQCVIFNFEIFGVVQAKLIGGILEVVRIPQVLVFADSAEENVQELIKKEQNLIFIEKPLLNFSKDVSGLCDRLINGGEPKYHREALRSPTDQKVSVTLVGTGRHYDGKVNNMSDKGACLEINTSIVKVNDKIKITMALVKLHRQRIISAEVRWIKPYPGKSIIGVRFTKPEGKNAANSNS